jgi:hypothetical protein
MTSRYPLYIFIDGLFFLLDQTNTKKWQQCKKIGLPLALVSKGYISHHTLPRKTSRALRVKETRSYYPANQSVPRMLRHITE